MKVWCVFKSEEHVGDFLMRIFTSEEKAKEYKSLVQNIDIDNEYFIESWDVE